MSALLSLLLKWSHYLNNNSTIKHSPRPREGRETQPRFILRPPLLAWEEPASGIPGTDP